MNTMNKMSPDFALENTKGEVVRLSDFRNKKIIILALLRGFA